MFIQTEQTPNPNSLKFYPNQVVNDGEPINYFNSAECVNSSLAQKLFSITHVQGVFFGHDFITLTKSDQIEWEVLKPEVLVTIMDHITAGHPFIDEANQNNIESSHSTLTAIEKQIFDVIETFVRPAVAQDGGDIIYKGFHDGTVYLQLRGACSGCPSSSITLKNGIESMLKRYVPEVQTVEEVES